MRITEDTSWCIESKYDKGGILHPTDDDSQRTRVPSSEAKRHPEYHPYPVLRKIIIKIEMREKI